MQLFIDEFNERLVAVVRFVVGSLVDIYYQVTS